MKDVNLSLYTDMFIINLSSNEKALFYFFYKKNKKSKGTMQMPPMMQNKPKTLNENKLKFIWLAVPPSAVNASRVSPQAEPRPARGPNIARRPSRDRNRRKRAAAVRGV